MYKKILLIGLAISLGGCGFKGPLYLPGHGPATDGGFLPSKKPAASKPAASTPS